MLKLYVYRVEDVEDDDFTNVPAIAVITGDSNKECEGKAYDEYGDVDYAWTYCELKTTHGGPRPGSGRPAVEDKKIARTIKFSDEEWNAVKEKASAEGVSASEFVRKKSLE